jgi:hypothetical protein
MTVSKKKTTGKNAVSKKAAAPRASSAGPRPEKQAKPGRARSEPEGGAREFRAQIRGLIEERDNQAAMLEAADAEREIIQQQLDHAQERIQQLEKQVNTSRSPERAESTSSLEVIEIDFDEEDEEPEEQVDTEDDVDDVYGRLDDPRVRRRELDRERLDREGEAGDEPYWLVCPKCGDSLEEVEAEDVKLERCEGCGGLYLDRGEVEMLLILGRGPRGIQRIRNVLQI